MNYEIKCKTCGNILISVVNVEFLCCPISCISCRNCGGNDLIRIDKNMEIMKKAVK